MEGDDQPLVVNDVHSRLSRTRVNRILRPNSVQALQSSVLLAKSADKQVAIMGGRHAMGGQQFGADTFLVDMTGLDRILDFDTERGLVEVEAGAFWPKFTSDYLALQQGAPRQWGYAQKQTGADDLSIGGTLAANGHGRGLTMQPFVSNVESFKLVNGEGNLLSCSREENAELFSLAIGGYGLFGIFYSVTLRLVPRQKIERIVQVREVDGLMDAFAERIRSGFVYGDFQFAIDPTSADFLNKGVFSCYCLSLPSENVSLSELL
jgi:FAD/FMN-containing dehydrogenase